MPARPNSRVAGKCYALSRGFDAVGYFDRYRCAAGQTGGSRREHVADNHTLSRDPEAMSVYAAVTDTMRDSVRL